MIIPLMGSKAYAQFNPLEQTCESAGGGGDAAAICNEAADPGDRVTGNNGIIVRVANMLAILAGIIAVIVIIISGITMMTSEGDAGKVAKSRSTIIYVVVGLFAVVLSRTIVVFIITRVMN
jgi:hypothetical protein